MGWDVVATDTDVVVSSVLRTNIAQNDVQGTIQVRELDWTVSPSEWTWTDERVIASSSSGVKREARDDAQADDLLGAPFDLIVTSDTVYSPSLIRPLLQTLHHISVLSISDSKSTSRRGPPSGCSVRTARARARF